MSHIPKTLIQLRPWSDGDLGLLERLMGDPRMTDHLGGPESPERIRVRHDRYLKTREAEDGRMYVIVVGPDHLPAGSIGYWERAWRDQTVWETGWSVLPEFQGQGVATQATLEILELARSNGRHPFIHAFPAVDNGPSNAICRKSGFTLAGPVEFESPPGHRMLCNDWVLDVQADLRALRPA